MWARKRIDIGWSDLLGGLGFLFMPVPPPFAGQIGERICPASDTSGGLVACLTERSGFDLLLKALAWPTEDEILVSAVTINDMVRIVEEHDLVPVPIDIDPSNMEPRMGAIEAAVTDRTRAILVAHLFGTICPMDAIIAWARPRGILVFEDCAQAYDGEYQGHPESDVVMFSFGPIKTATALGGGLLKVRDDKLCERMNMLHAKYPRQARTVFARRVFTFTMLKTIAGRLPFRLLIAACRLLRRDHDTLLNNSVKNVSGDFFQEIRQQPSGPLLRMMRRRIRNFDRRRVEQRAAKGRRLAEILTPLVTCPGSAASSHSYWIFLAQFDDRKNVVDLLCRTGFDATAGTALCPVKPPDSRPELDPVGARQSLEKALHLPVYPEMPDREIERLGQTIVKTLT